MSDVALDRPISIHVIGIGGAGMSAIATVLAQMGHKVSGSDLRGSAVLERLSSLGIRVFVGHRAEQLGEADLVAYSTAIPADNVELAAAIAQGRRTLRRSELLSAITSLRSCVSVAGTHGKTTTSSMLSVILSEAGLRPSFLIGGELNAIGTNAVWDSGSWLVTEADESDGTFVELSTDLALVTNVEADHLDHYGSFASLRAAFERFVAGATIGAVVCGDDEVAAQLLTPDTISYGFSPSNRLHVVNFGGGRSNVTFDLVLDGTSLGRFELPVPGEHNARNAAGAIAGALQIGAPADAARRALARFGGVARRFEFRGERAGVSFVDDYAHLPGEVRAAIAAARRGGWGRIVCVFQPHRFTRTEALAPAFADAFVDADVVVVTQIYPAGEMPRPGVSARLVVDAVREAHPDRVVEYLPEREALLDYLVTELRAGDCCLSLGAGDLTTLPDELLSRTTW